MPEYDKCACGKNKQPQYPKCFTCSKAGSEKSTTPTTQPSFGQAKAYTPDDESKNNAMVLAYVKDLVVADKITLQSMPELYAAFRNAVKTGNLELPIMEDVVR